MWQGSLVPWTGPTGAPRAGAKVYFFDSGTTTPKITYTDSSLSIPHDHPVVADASGSFPAIFLVEQTTYRLRVTTSDDVTLEDVDGISVPTTTPPEAPSGATDAEFLYQTGDIKMAWRTAAPNGYVRANGRTIGSPTSGASERANADCEALFLFLWTQDSNLAVSGGRGGTNTGDWAANKTIVLPDFRGRVPAGLDSMGNSAAGRLTDTPFGADTDTLGSAGGAEDHELTTGELASHTHTGTTDSDGAHTHGITLIGRGGNAAFTLRSPAWGQDDSTTAEQTVTTASGGAHTHDFTTDASGSGTAHNNTQPTVLVPYFIKL